MVPALKQQKNNNQGGMRELDFQSYHNIILRMFKSQQKFTQHTQEF